MSKSMDIQLINGAFGAADALDLITRMIHIKIKFHEDRINQNSSEEDIKYRESKIRNLQKELFQLREGIGREKGTITLDATINISVK
ncbi:MAG: hypothetical protein IPN44_01200 [Flavobacteriales bacterium]|nr:hypothetical protein [Flavobacteriales bacterium]